MGQLKSVLLPFLVQSIAQCRTNTTNVCSHCVLNRDWTHYFLVCQIQIGNQGPMNVFDVGTRSRRRASEPRPGGVASRCLSRARESSPARYARSSCHLLTRSASSARARARREAQEVSAAPGRAFFGLPFFARAKKGNPLPRGQRHLSRSGIAAGDTS